MINLGHLQVAVKEGSWPQVMEVRQVAFEAMGCYITAFERAPLVGQPCSGTVVRLSWWSALLVLDNGHTIDLIDLMLRQTVFFDMAPEVTF